MTFHLGVITIARLYCSAISSHRNRTTYLTGTAIVSFHVKVRASYCLREELNVDVQKEAVNICSHLAGAHSYCKNWCYVCLFYKRWKFRFFDKFIKASMQKFCKHIFIFLDNSCGNISIFACLRCV